MSAREVRVSKSLTQKLKEAKAEIKMLEENVNDLTSERDRHRSFIVSEMKSQLECLGENKHWPAKVVVERIAKHMAQSKQYWWW